MIIRKCLEFLFFVWLGFLAAGIWFYLFSNRHWPQPFREGDIRNRFIRPWRFAVYILLAPAGLTITLAILLIWAADAGIIPEF